MSDPYKKYGGKAAAGADPYAKYGGSSANDDSQVPIPNEAAPFLNGNAPITTNEGLAPVAKPSLPSFVGQGLTNGGTLYNDSGVPVDAENKPLGKPKKDIETGETYYDTGLLGPSELPMTNGQYDPEKSPLDAPIRATTGEVVGGLGDIGEGNVAHGTHRIFKGVGTASLPLVAKGFGEAPLATIFSLAGATAAGKTARAAGKEFGATPDQQDVMEDFGNVLGGGATGKLTAAMDNVPNPLARENAIYLLRKAFNPNFTDAPGFQREIGNQLDTILGHAKDNGLVKSPYGVADSLAKTAKAAAQNDPYRTTFIDPYATDAVSTGHIPGHEPMETIGQLDSRLHTINSTLRPRYVAGPDGSPQQVASVDAEQAAALQREGGLIRQTLANEISKRTGVPADQVAAARKNYGELSDLADTMQQYADIRTAQQFGQQNGPISINPFNHGKGFILDKAINAMRGDPVANAINKVIAGYNPHPPVPFTPTGGGTPPAPRTPIWMQQAEASQVPIPEELEAVLNRESEAPIVSNGKVVTVRAQRAGKAAQAARQAQANATPATPPNAAGTTEQVGPTPAPGGPPLRIRELTNGGVEGAPQLPGATLSGASDSTAQDLTGNTVDVTGGGAHPDTQVPDLLRQFLFDKFGTETPSELQQFLAKPASVRRPAPGTTPIRVVNGNAPISKADTLPDVIRSIIPEPVNFDSGAAEDAATMGVKDRVNVFSPNGHYGHIPASQVPQALKIGYKLAEPLAQFNPNSAKPGKVH